MVDVSGKPESERVAVARARVRMAVETLELIRSGQVGKGDVLGTARLAGIMASKRTAELIPLCHTLGLTGVGIRFRLDDSGQGVEIESRVRTVGRTGVEMEALVAAAAAALTIIDMCKAADSTMVVDGLRLVHKRGGRKGIFIREGEEPWEEKAWEEVQP